MGYERDFGVGADLFLSSPGVIGFFVLFFIRVFRHLSCVFCCLFYGGDCDRVSASAWWGLWLNLLVVGKDHRVKAQVATYVASGYTFINMPLTALLYIGRSCDLIEAGNLQFIPTCGRPPEFSEDLHETLVALSQTVYLANYLYLMCGGPEPHATVGLEREFRQELPVGGLISVHLDIQLIPGT